jgi:hypothetical protein
MTPYMPEVDAFPAQQEATFREARKIAANGIEMRPGGDAERCVVIITPGRMMVLIPLPPPGSLPAHVVSAVRRAVPEELRNISVIAFNDLLKPLFPNHKNKQGITVQRVKSAIPLLGFLIALAHNGHNLTVFEGHPSALAFGCQDADLLIIDEAMQSCLQDDWPAVAAPAMRSTRFVLFTRNGKVIPIDPESGMAHPANSKTAIIAADDFDAVLRATHAGPLPLTMVDPASYAAKPKKAWWWPFG